MLVVEDNCLLSRWGQYTGSELLLPGPDAWGPLRSDWFCNLDTIDNSFIVSLFSFCILNFFTTRTTLVYHANPGRVAVVLSSERTTFRSLL